MSNRKTKFLIIYVFVNLFTLSMLFMLQISEIPIFFVWLVLMHLGIIGLAITKKKFSDLRIKTYFKRVYMSFALFIPVLIYKLIVAIFSIEENELLISYSIIFVMIICIIILMLNIFSFILYNKKQAMH